MKKWTPHDVVNDIRLGAGWATDEYVDNYVPAHFSQDQTFEVKKRLARLNLLFREHDGITESESMPEAKYRISLEQVRNDDPNDPAWIDPAGGFHSGEANEDPALMYI